ncbi:hypothetical protein CTI12_AA583170 [Artemisia annua]|uniref:WLM domain-containing protein n=1 Tax=Artemisia annua TaxID=35608 RepID=A0A2U1KN87_ARTAN|nr:hypothetical protein CTI12_AA583170 [Artemisia annua]
MEQERNDHEISVTWRGNKYVVTMDLSATLEELGRELQKLTAVKADTLKLIVQSRKASKLFSPFSDEHSRLTLQETSIEGKPIRMMGVPQEEVDQVLKGAKTDMRIAGFDEEEKRMRQRMSNGFDAPLQLPSGNYVFADFKALELPGIELYPPPSEALRLMHTLAADKGIVAIMNKHKWRVGIMTEMAPEGYVGVSPVCILGLNKNQGEEISLRLRTDDLKGFRKYQSIKKTLLHELAHMVFSEHDAKFYALDSQLNKEAAALDWTRSTGHTLSGSQKTQQYGYEFHATDNSNSSSSLSHKLGGSQSSSSLANARASSVAAAYQRLVIASTNPSTTPESRKEPDPDDSMDVTMNKPDAINISEEQTYEPDPDDQEVLNNKNEPDPDDSINSEAMESEPSGESTQNIITPELNHGKTEEKNEPDPDDGILEDEELQRIQDPVMIACNRLKKSIETLQSEVSPAEAAMVFQTLVKIVKNVIEHPNEIKFKKLRKVCYDNCHKRK